jgi:glycosidase
MIRSATELWEYLPKIKLAAEAYFMLPGTPFVYYGEELGFPNGKNEGDYSKRMPMQWTRSGGFGFTAANQAPWQPFLGRADAFSVEAQANQKASLLELYKKLIHFRNNSPLIALGDLDHILSNKNAGLVMWRRRYQGTTALVIVNFSYKTAPSFTLDPAMGDYSRIVKVLYGNESGGQLLSSSDRSALVIPALSSHSVHVFQVE